MLPDRHDVLVIGGGPAGSAAGLLAGQGRPRRLRRGAQGRSPGTRRAATGSRRGRCTSSGRWAWRPASPPTTTATTACGRSPTASRWSCAWPEHPVFPSYGYVVRRRDLDRMVAEHAAGAGAVVLPSHRGGAPAACGTAWSRARSSRTSDTGETREIRARYVIVADGANSRFGRALGTSRNRVLPPGHGHPRLLRQPAVTTTRGSSRASTCATGTATPCPGYGWIFPVGDGTINVGVGLLSTFQDYKDVNTTHLMTECAATAPERWGIDPETRRSRRPPAAACRWPARSTRRSARTGSSSATPAGSINPFNGEGIDYAYETGRMAADLVDEALATGDGPAAVRAIPRCSTDEYGLYFKVARHFATIIGQPVLMRELTRVGHAQPLAHGVGAADHGQPAARGRARPGRGRVQGRGTDRPAPS